MLGGLAIMVLVGSIFFWKQLLITNIEVPFESPPRDALYRLSAYSVTERVADLLSRMTLQEKIGQMALVEKNSVHDVDDISSYAIGALLSGAGAKPNDNSVVGWRNMVAEFNRSALRSRLGIPLLYGVDAIHGHAGVLGATVFPHAIGLGATGDEALVEQIARATARELRATGIQWSFSPNLDLPQDIRWGRTYESFSDDPILVTRLGAAYVRGLQDDRGGGTTTLSVLSTPKHYIGAGGMVWGSSSNKAFKVDQGMTPEDETLLRTTYLPPFAEAVNTGVKSVMVGLNSWGNVKLASEKYLITDLLKGELGFSGFVVSDWYGVYEIPGGEYTAAVAAINAGIDMVMLPFDYKTFIKNVTRAVEKGDISEARIDDAVRRILTAKFSLGLFDAEEVNDVPEEAIGTPNHRALARKAVSESLVLLKNEASVLPISSTVKHIRVGGSAADNVGQQSGAWTVEWQGIDGNWLPNSTSILSGIRTRAKPGVTVEYAIDGTFATETVKAELGIAVVGEKPYAEGWGDTENLSLNASDLHTIERMRATSKRLVVIIVSGRPLIITDELKKWDAAIAAWLPGSEGGGVADVIFGDAPFTGKLPLPWPRSIVQLPLAPGGTTKDGTQALFPRYFGLRIY